MSVKTVCFVSSKGGSGKTVTSSALGTFLAALGFRVLLVDTDAATNGMTLLYLEQLLGQRRGRSERDVPSVGLFEAKEDLLPTRIEIDGNLHIVPAAFTMSDTEKSDHVRFEAALQTLVTNDEQYDFIFLDAQAGTDAFARISVTHAEQCVVVSEYDPVSVQGIERLKVLFANVMSPSSTWVLFNKVLPEFTSVIGEGLAIARYLTPIPWDADVVRAFARRDLAVNMQLPNPYTLAISQVAYNLFPDETGNAIEQWRGVALSNVTTPVEERLRELQRTERELRRSDAMSRILRTTNNMLVAAGFVVMSLFFLSQSAGRRLTTDFLNAITHNFSWAVVIGVAIPPIVYFAFRSMVGRATFRDRSLGLVLDERKKLQATLEAAEKTIKFDKSAGYYEHRRRSPAPVRLTKSDSPTP